MLLTATPHNGKEEDFQLFLRLLDADRFEGRFRGGVQKVDVPDLMRHLVKERLYTFDGTPLFPERLAYTINYQLSSCPTWKIRSIPKSPTTCATSSTAPTPWKTAGARVSSALPSPPCNVVSPRRPNEAISQSLRRRRERLEMRLREVRQSRHGEQTVAELWQGVPLFNEDDLDDLDDAEVEAAEEQVMDQATAARTIAELEIEIRLLALLEQRAQQVRRSGTDRKWEELAGLLQGKAEMFDAEGHRLKLVIFTEHRDTLNYLVERTRTLLGRAEAVVTIHGGMSREERRAAQEAFTQDKETQILVATDAVGEGINLQRAHLMVNYDLPRPSIARCRDRSSALRVP